MSRKTAFALVVLAAVVCMSMVRAVPARAQDAPSNATAMKEDMLHWIGDAESKLNQLAEAMPESKYSWRPGKGVRSVGEVFMHVATSNYFIPMSWGASAVPPPAGFDPKTNEKSLTKKADIQKALEASFASLKANISALTDEDMDRGITLFGMPMTVRSACFLLLSHCHEHLGQSIAYARTNNVVPPWSMPQASAKESKKAE